MIDFALSVHGLAAVCAGAAAGSGWTGAVIVANTAFDGLDYGRADRHLRKLLTASAGFQAELLAIAAGLCLLSGATAGAVTALVGALGFISNMWTLAPRTEKHVPGAHRKLSSARIVAISLTLMMTLTAAAAGVLAAFGI